MLTSEIRIVAVVVTYNRKEMLEQCLRALLRQTRQVDRIVVIDNSSTDNTPDLFTEGSEFGLENVLYHRLDRNAGGAGGFKEGMRIAMELCCDWCWIMDDDVIPRDSALESLVTADEYLVGCGVEPSFLASHVSGPHGEIMNVPNVSYHIAQNGYPDWCEYLPYGLVRIVSATFVSLLISAKAMAQVGLPISDYFLWGDDTEYTTRLTSYYGPAFACGSSEVVHMRQSAHAISTFEETDPVRVDFRRRATRNDLITTSYYEGKLKTTRRILRRVRECAQIAMKAPCYRARKVRAISGGVLDFLAHRYNLEDLAKLDKKTMKRY